MGKFAGGSPPSVTLRAPRSIAILSLRFSSQSLSAMAAEQTAAMGKAVDEDLDVEEEPSATSAIGAAAPSGAIILERNACF